MQKIAILAIIAIAVMAGLSTASAKTESIPFSDVYSVIHLRINDGLNVCNDDTIYHSIVGIMPNGGTLDSLKVQPGNCFAFSLPYIGNYTYLDGQTGNTGVIVVTPDYTNVTDTITPIPLANAPVQLAPVINDTNHNTTLQLNPVENGLPPTLNYTAPNETQNYDNATVIIPQPQVVNDTQVDQLSKKIDTLTNTITALNTKIDNMKIEQDSIFGQLNQLLRYFRIV